MVKDFVGDEDDVELDVVGDREQAKVTQKVGDVAMRATQQSFGCEDFRVC